LRPPRVRQSSARAAHLSDARRDARRRGRVHAPLPRGGPLPPLRPTLRREPLRPLDPTAAPARLRRVGARGRDSGDAARRRRDASRCLGDRARSARHKARPAALRRHRPPGGRRGDPERPRLRVHLLPAEREHADDVLRFFETTPGADGAFLFKNLPPGRYLLLARLAADANDATPRPASWDADARARLRREAEAANTTVELQPCQRATDFALRFPPLPK